MCVYVCVCVYVCCGRAGGLMGVCILCVAVVCVAFRGRELCGGGMIGAKSF